MEDQNFVFNGKTKLTMYNETERSMIKSMYTEMLMEHGKFEESVQKINGFDAKLDAIDAKLNKLLAARESAEDEKE
jgi:hypothetical protein